ncbi:YceH family protein [Aliikangiella coralliicola]|uniref:DUF480 domain-containing protein n=1 Tax=Aliikangiella coralliicola TaxID=2592383 RepID=A0A545UIH8_9GAMM|nr:DUF480 domain-containing protein [Aliikangiella coralliicola]
MQLSQLETRVIGCLIEKSITTPDQYPLSLNSLTNACNQKSNRDPVLSLSETEVQETLDSLNEKRLIMNQSGASSRVPKYKHRFCNTEFSDLQFSAQELGVICVLFLRGPQTPGELRTRTNRLCQFDNVQETEALLNKLSESDNGPYVVKLPREPGRRESRYAHLFGDQEESVAQIAEPESTGSSVQDSDRLSALEEQVALMQMEIDELREKLQELS